MNLSIKRTSKEDIPTVQLILEASPGYYQKVEGSPVLPHFAEKEMYDCPNESKRSNGYEKIFCLLYKDEGPVGVIDLHKDHPTIGTAYLGLLLIRQELQGNGLGRHLYTIIEAFVKKELSANKIKLGVAEENNVEGFWAAMGFKRNGHTYIWKGENLENHVFEMEKNI